MNVKKILDWKNWYWKNYIVFIAASIVVILILQSIVFVTAPTKAEVERFFNLDKIIPGCNPYATEIDDYDEYFCAYNLRRHTALVFGQIVNAGFPLAATNPFGYFNYDPTSTDPAEFGESSTESLNSRSTGTFPNFLPSILIKQTLLSFNQGM